ncbi:MAG TPA: folate hydrolase [Gammaproteobacteria bacterium]|nr:folate hydrolase [Gammaproteobacteria bacterium]HCP48986.1 folate hydrolase [Gammaproteobacteria bacterium]
MKRALFFWIALLSTTAGQTADVLLGFDLDASDKQRELESRLASDISADDLHEWIEALAAKPHHVDSEHGKHNAAYIASLFKQWGYATHLATYEVLIPVPKVRVVEMLEPEFFRATLEERIIESDSSTAMRDQVLPPYNAFSPDGDVTGNLVYVNYGTREDYETLDRYGVDVTGNIVIARYGKVWRGIKPKLAAEHGAIGALIYSDPIDDGYVRGSVYPDGPYKNDSAIQRGAVMDLPLHAGDVLTPGWAATKGARRLDRDEATAIATIPVLPISYADAEPLLKHLSGPMVPSDWRGALPISYHLGPGPAQVRLHVEFDWQTVTARNVIARRKGSVFPDEWVIRGNHHDAWNHGARDPVSGLVTMLAEARAIARLDEPIARTIIYAAWDAEEPGLMGSTEWVEEHARELSRKAVAYLNTDGMGRGFVSVGASHTLERFFNQLLSDVKDPQTKLSIGERRRARIRINGNEKAVSELTNRRDLRVAALGSGSDYTAFLHHLGIASANLSFGGEAESGSYHTLYDTHEHFHRFIDPGNAYGTVLAELAGRATLRLANARIVPFDFSGLLDNVKKFVAEIEESAETQRKETTRINALIDAGSYTAALDQTKSLRAPQRHDPVPHFNFSPIHNAIAKIERSIAVLDPADLINLNARQLKKINRLLYTSERLFLRDQGLPRRSWYRHQLYAPGFYTGYGVKTLPMIREAIEERRFSDVPDAVVAVSGVLNTLADRIDELHRTAQ